MSKRTVHIDGKEFKYNIGSQYINIWTPDGKRHNVDLAYFFDISWNDIERARWKGCFNITPSDVKFKIRDLYDPRLGF